METIWLLTFDNIDFADCNGVFSTREKALDAFKTHCDRNPNLWSNPKVDEDSGNWLALSFHYHDDYYDNEELCWIEEMEIDKI